MRSRVFIIAEAGVNHDGDLRTALRLVDAAARAGADAVKFQTFRADRLAAPAAPKAAYQERSTSARQSQRDMLRELELGRSAHVALRRRCRDRGVEFISSPFDLESVALLAELGVRTIKIPSGAIDDLPYLRAVGALRRKLILSTGMADLAEVRRALRVLTAAGARRKDITVLHCHTEYPTAMEHVNLRAMDALARACGTAVGLSDHTRGIEVPAAAAALGARVIEKHLTLSRRRKGPDHAASLEPAEFSAMVHAVRNVEAALGSGRKAPTAVELRNRRVARKSIAAARDIRRGEVFSADNLTTLRPAQGLSPMAWDKVLGRAARRGFRAGEPIRL
jgi:N,N'-diacetyllegionaminate synthase